MNNNRKLHVYWFSSIFVKPSGVFTNLYVTSWWAYWSTAKWIWSYSNYGWAESQLKAKFMIFIHNLLTQKHFKAFTIATSCLKMGVAHKDWSCKMNKESIGSRNKENNIHLWNLSYKLWMLCFHSNLYTLSSILETASVFQYLNSRLANPVLKSRAQEIWALSILAIKWAVKFWLI